MTDEIIPAVEPEASPVTEAAEPAPVEAQETAAEDTPAEPGVAAEPEPEPEPSAADRLVRVTAKGDGRIFKGFAFNGVEQTHAEGDEVTLPTEQAQAHLDQGFAEEA